MQRILTGIQSSGIPHLGNLYGVILPTLKAIQRSQQSAYLFVADLHSLTTQRDPQLLRHHTYAIAASWLACGLDPTKHILYRQSRIPQVTELSWYLSCFTPYPMLANAHAFKDKADNLNQVPAGLFTYPILMAADIALYNATHVPVGHDQKQHLEITRDIIRSFNHHYGQTLTLPQALIQDKVSIFPGTDGHKMSKSYKNTISPFIEEKALRDTIMSIPTDSKSFAEIKDPDTCRIFSLYTHLASPKASQALRKRYLAGNYGYGHAKKELFSLILETFSQERKKFHRYMQDPKTLEEILCQGESKAEHLANTTLEKVRKAIGYSTNTSLVH